MEINLSKREKQVLRWLSFGRTYREIRILLNDEREKKNQLRSVTMENVHSTCGIIRKKTGIKNTGNPQECRAVLQNRHFSEMPFSQVRPTRRQLAVWRLLAQGVPYRDIAAQLGLTSHQSAQNYASQGCKRAKINVPPWQRTHAIRTWLEKYDQPLPPPARPETDPMDDPAF